MSKHLTILNRYLILLLLVFKGISMSGQEVATLKGSVVDSITNQTLSFATIYVTQINKGFTTDKKGNFEIDLKKGNYTIQTSFLGYNKKQKTISLQSDSFIKFQLTELSVNVEGVTVSAKNPDDNTQSNRAGILQLSSKEIEHLPSLMGKPDIINALRLTPGVQGGGEGNTGLYVRGGDAGQNLILLDNMTLYNPSHLLGFFPVFNSDIIDNVTVIKGGIPAQYGGKTSSVIDISMREGSSNKFAAKGSIGFLSSDITLETSINQGKGSLIISGRRTYMDVIKFMVKPFKELSSGFFDNTDYYFYDGSLKFRYNLGEKTRLYISGFGGQDFYSMIDPEFNISNKMSWSNFSGAIRINHLFSDKFSMNIASGKTLYSFNIDAGFDKYVINLFSEIDDWKNSLDFTYLPNKKTNLKFGASYTTHTLTPNSINVDVEDIYFNNNNKYLSNEWSVYFNGELKINSSFSISGGVRSTLFQHVGPYTHYIKNEVGKISDSTTYASNEVVKSYFTLDPNLNWIYIIDKKSSIKGSLSMNHQFIHLASVGTVSLPTDIWLPSTSFIPPQRVSQITAGYFRNFFNNTFETSFELYYKYLENQVDFLNGIIDNVDNTKIEENIIIGKGHAFGAEFYIKKQIGNTTGWISYTLSRTLRQFDEINNGDFFPAKYDRIHDFSVVINHKINDKWTLSATFVFATGNALTLPAGRYVIQGNVANHYTDVNSFRMPAYHRLDVSANYQLKKIGHMESWLNFSIYNLYSHSNPYFIYFQVKGDLDNYKLSVQPKQISLFPILPSITWSFKF